MHKFIRFTRNTILVLVGFGLIFWKFFALTLIPANHPVTARVLNLIWSPLAESWVDFYRWNTYFQESLDSESTNDAKKRLSLSIDAYLKSLSVRETKEARENLEFVKNKLKSLEQEKPSPKNSPSPSEGGAGTDSASGTWSFSGTGSISSASSSSGRRSTEEDVASETGAQIQWTRWFSNTGTFQSFSWSIWTGSGLTESDMRRLEQSRETLRSLQKNKSEYTRPFPRSGQENSIDSIFKQYFGDERGLFRGEIDTDPYNY